MNLDTVVCADALDYLRTLPDESVNCIITSPPYYGLRDYGASGQIGLEDTPAAYVERLVAVFREIRRVLRPDGVCWLNLGDSYAGSGRGLMGDGTPSDRGDAKQGTNRGTTVGVFNKPDWGGLAPKNLIGIPWRVAFALQDDGWILRSDVIWHKPNTMPESVTDRPTKAHEYVFMLTRAARYWYDAEAVAETSISAGEVITLGEKSFSKGQAIGAGIDPSGNGKAASYEVRPTRNRRSVWTVATEPTPFAHFATFPQKLIEPMVLAGCPAGGIVCDPFMGSGTTALVARRLGRHFLGCDVNAEYVALANERLAVPYTLPMFV